MECQHSLEIRIQNYFLFSLTFQCSVYFYFVFQHSSPDIFSENSMVCIEKSKVFCWNPLEPLEILNHMTGGGEDAEDFAPAGATRGVWFLWQQRNIGIRMQICTVRERPNAHASFAVFILRSV